MLLKNKKILTSVVIMITFLFIGCNNSRMDKAYDDNKQISKRTQSYSLNNSKERAENGKYKGDFKLSGHGTVWEYDSKEDCEIQAPCTFKVENGKAKIVLISPDDTVTTLIEDKDKTSTENKINLKIPIKKGKNRIKVVGYGNAHINIQLEIDKGRLKEIGC